MSAKSNPAPDRNAPSKAPWWHRMWQGKFLYVSVLLHLLFILGATLWITQTIQLSRKTTFNPGPPSRERAVEHKIQMAKRQNATSAPAVAKRVTSTALSTVTLPEMPELPTTEDVTPTVMAGMGGQGVGASPGGPSGGGGGSSGGTAPPFGFREAQPGGSLTGTFYDLKQDKKGGTTNMTEEGYDWTLKQFVSGGWKDKDLDRFFQAPEKLYATQIFIPLLDANVAPQSFNVGDKVQPRLWCIVYKGKITPNESGTYRFAGFADDVLVVRLRNKVILDCGFANMSGMQPQEYLRSEGLALGGSLPPSYKGLGLSDSFTVSAGSSYEIEILVGERPGGQFKAYLMLQRVGAEYKKDKAGTPILPIFKMAPSRIPRVESEAPAFAKDGPVWSSTPPKKSFFDLN